MRINWAGPVQRYFYIVDNRLSGLFDKKASDFLDRKVFSFTPKDVISLSVGLKRYLSKDGIYYDVNGKPVADALKLLLKLVI